MTMLEQYEPMLLALFGMEPKEQVDYYQVLENTKVFEREIYFQGILQNFSEEQQAELERKKQKVKI